MGEDGEKSGGVREKVEDDWSLPYRLALSVRASLSRTPTDASARVPVDCLTASTKKVTLSFPRLYASLASYRLVACRGVAVTGSEPLSMVA